MKWSLFHYYHGCRHLAPHGGQLGTNLVCLPGNSSIMQPSSDALVVLMKFCFICSLVTVVVRWTADQQVGWSKLPLGCISSNISFHYPKLSSFTSATLWPKTPINPSIFTLSDQNLCQNHFRTKIWYTELPVSTTFYKIQYKVIMQ